MKSWEASVASNKGGLRDEMDSSMKLFATPHTVCLSLILFLRIFHSFEFVMASPSERGSAKVEVGSAFEKKLNVEVQAYS